MTDCFGEGVIPKNRSDVTVDFDLLEIIQELKKEISKRIVYRKYLEKWSDFSLEVVDKTLLNY